VLTCDAVTGAFGFTGRHIATRLLANGRDVINLTNHPDRPDPFEGRVQTAPLNFSQPDALVAALEGVDTLFNTYWMRFAREGSPNRRAVQDSGVLFDAARAAGVRRIVHISIANPDANSALPYYRGKALVEQALIATGVSCAILRPAALFGDEPILVNTIAWMLRRLPIFGIPGDGQYGIQPTFVGDLANLAVAQGRRNEPVVVDAVGPERFTFDEFVRLIRDAVGSHALLLHLPPRLALTATQGLGLMLRDVIMTREEVDGLLANLLVSRHPPLGTTRFTDWLADASPWLGRRYLSELGRRLPSAG
jgi:uncharacterized protein YbjT (DUF2867 family)